MGVNLRTLLTIVLGTLVTLGCDESPKQDRIDAFTGLADAGVVEVDAADVRQPEPDAALEMADAFVRPTRLNSVFPARSPTEGGVAVRIVGQDFLEGMIVRVGNRGCSQIEVMNENHLKCVLPPSDNPGPADVEVTWPDSSGSETLEGAITYFRPIELLRIDPPRGPTAGSITITVRGSGFVEGTEILLGDKAVRVDSVTEDGTLATFICPAGEPGTVDVTARNINGDSTLPDGFSWFEELMVEDILPAYGSVAGGEDIRLAGIGLMEASVVSLGNADGAVVRSELERRSLTVRTPAAERPGPVDVVVSNSNGQWTVPHGFLYLAEAADEFTVTGFVPSRIPADAGGQFLVGGNGFNETTTVEVDSVQVPCTLKQPQLMECQVGPHVPGAVPVRVTTGDVWSDWPAGLTFYEQIEIYDVSPARGSIAGGAIVEITGRGFNESTQFSFEGTALDVVDILDSETVLAVTPASRSGWVSLRAENDDDLAVLPLAFEYFDPVAGFGGVWGEPIDRAVNISTLDGMTGRPISGTTVFVTPVGGVRRWESITNEEGIATISDRALELPVSVTAAKEGYTTTTFERVTAENTTILLMPLQPPMGMGMMEPEPPIVLSGAVRGMNELSKPNEEGLILVTFVETTHDDPNNRLLAGPPMPNGLLLEDGPFRIVVRQGELAVVAVAGYIEAEMKRRYDEGRVPYWTLRDSLQPIAMGLRRFLTVAPGDMVGGLDIPLDIPMDTTVDVTLGNPSAGQPGAPNLFTANAILALGADGYFDFRNMTQSDQPQMQVRSMPNVNDWPDPDVKLRWEGEAEQDDPEELYRYASAHVSVRDMSDGVVIGPFVANVNITSPQNDGQLGLFRWVQWELIGGLLGPQNPPEPADLHLVRIVSQRSVVWTHWVPGAANGFQYPSIPDGAGLRSGLPIGPLQLSVYSIKIDGNFSFENFTYDDLSRMRALSWSYVVFLN